MILAELELENYKQYTGKHLFRPSEGVIGIIGQNGVGKSTLFEAIEWCLYNPREIPNDELRPRGKAGHPRVKLTLQDPCDGVRYVVERVLKKSSVSAEIWREDQAETRIVHGSKPVAEYVAKTLIGLDHHAFVSTFFTRQKELSFFGSMGDTDRRREVSRLLGFETIRDAQRMIADERSLTEAEAKGIASQFQEQSKDRNFAAEIEAQDNLVAASAHAVAEAIARLTASSAALVVARERLTRLQELERKDSNVLREIERIGGDIREAIARRDSANHELEIIATSEARRGELSPIAEGEQEARAAVEVLDRERDRHLALKGLQDTVSRAQNGIRRDVIELERIVNDSASPFALEWVFKRTDAKNPLAAAERLIAIGDRVDAKQTRQRAEALVRCYQLEFARQDAENKLRKFEDRLREIEDEHRQLIVAGNPKAEAETSAAEREAALLEAEQQRAMATRTLKTRGLIANIVFDLRAQKFDTICPTCARSFSEESASIQLAALEDQIESFDLELADLKAHEEQAKQKAAECDLRRITAVQRLEKVNNLEGRIVQSKPHIDSAKEEFERKTAECAAALKEYGLVQPPTTEEVDTARAEADALQRVQSALGAVRQLRTSLCQVTLEIESTEQEIVALGPVAYDADAHGLAQAALVQAFDAAATIRRIDLELKRRPQLEAERQRVETAIARLDQEKTTAEQARAALGFDPLELEQATVSEQAALDEERAALGAKNDAVLAQRGAETARDNLLADQERIIGLSQKAEQRQREADELQRMFREFNLFDQYVANKVTPELASHASALVAEVTEGKYVQIEFDDNYGIRVFDGDEHFPLEEFSGGERDVIALCARLALSRIVGSQARRPLSFLVLDEVFGSLDRDRRERLLETLERLSGTAEAFRQLFIISHVDDVLLASAMNEIWRVTETADGVSELENRTQTRGVEDR
ncbi:MAG: AAA family ATPase [Thermomicrobiales bacterium]